MYLKKEFLQFTGSFKERGARNALLHLSPEQKKLGVVSASLGKWNCENYSTREALVFEIGYKASDKQLDNKIILSMA